MGEAPSAYILVNKWSRPEYLSSFIVLLPEALVSDPRDDHWSRLVELPPVARGGFPEPIQGAFGDTISEITMALSRFIFCEST